MVAYFELHFEVGAIIIGTCVYSAICIVVGMKERQIGSHRFVHSYSSNALNMNTENSSSITLRS
jgi:hypothetical protein